ncbi:effector-associated constant component EACC1 [Microbispora sp. H10670]|uniref:effector-associated constant component EACC1 n=1 Tax=unclassified Microbispora TaxID=2614687 RepID=UPI0016028B9A|nr:MULTISPECIES: hypothetical protein [unclassified Microbispora]
MELKVSLDAGSEADEIEIERLSRNLRGELLDLDVDDVRHLPDSAPANAKAGDGAIWTTLLVTLSASGGVITTIIAAINGWLSRRQEPVTVTVQFGDNSITLPNATDEERRLLLDAFIAQQERH